MDTKQELREFFLNFRRNLKEEVVESASQEIKLKFFRLEEVLSAWRFMLYASFRNEVKTGTLIRRLLREGREVYLPYCIARDSRLEISPIMNPELDLSRGTMGIMEPVEKLNSPVDRLDIVVVPGLAFNRDGYRIGYGGGYYDRFLDRLPAGTTTIGFTYQAMLVESLPVARHDLPVDIIITEEEVIYAGGVKHEPL